MPSSFRFTFLTPLLPVTAAGMLFQALAGLFYPQSEIGTKYLLSLEVLFTTEFVFMHSAIFFEGRRVIKQVWLQYVFATVLFAVYSLFLIPLLKKDPWVGVNYVMLTLTRLFTYKNPIEHTEFYKALDKEAQKMMPAMLALFKAGAVFLFIPLIVFTIPLPSGNLTTDVVMKLFPDHNAPKDFISMVKMFALYFLIMTALDIRKTIKRFTQPKVEAKVPAKSKKAA